MTLCRERTAVQQLMEVAKDTKSGGPAEGAHVHVVHLSDAEETLSLIKVYFASTFVVLTMYQATNDHL